MIQGALYNFYAGHPERWAKQAQARDKDGISVSPYDPAATCWCLLGACTMLGIDIDCLNKVRQLVKSPATTFNDRVDLTFDEFLAKLKEAGV